MRKFFLALFCFCYICSHAQQNPADLDKSPMDMSYAPQNYPILKLNGTTKELPSARVIYSRPQKAGRIIFGGIVNYNQVWRLGANEATEIDLFRNVKINGKAIPKGKYSLYAICTETKWTIIFNSETDVWGLYYNSQKDVLRTDIPVINNNKITEALTMYFKDNNSGSDLVILWDAVKVVLPFTY